MNKGILKARGDYFLFLNSGDWLVEDALGKAFEALSGEDIIYFDSYLSYPDGRIEQLNYPVPLTMRHFYRRTIGHQSTFIKKDLFEKYGLYNEYNRINSDYEFWLKTIIAGNCTCKQVPQFLTYYDMSGLSSLSDNLSRKEGEIILKSHLPERVISDYAFWSEREREMEIMAWYKRQRILYQLMIFIYKVFKNIRRLFGLPY